MYSVLSTKYSFFMTAPTALTDSTDELHPHLLYRTGDGQAAFTTWRLADGPEALALFSTAAKAEQYRSELAESSQWSCYQPPRDKLITIFEASLAAGIRSAALDPLTGRRERSSIWPRLSPQPGSPRIDSPQRVAVDSDVPSIAA